MTFEVDEVQHMWGAFERARQMGLSVTGLMADQLRFAGKVVGVGNDVAILIGDKGETSYVRIAGVMILVELPGSGAHVSEAGRRG